MEVIEPEIIEENLPNQESEIPNCVIVKVDEMPAFCSCAGAYKEVVAKNIDKYGDLCYDYKEPSCHLGVAHHTCTVICGNPDALPWA